MVHLWVSNVELQYASKLLLEVVELHLKHCELVQRILPADKNLTWMNSTFVAVDGLHGLHGTNPGKGIASGLEHRRMMQQRHERGFEDEIVIFILILVIERMASFTGISAWRSQ